MNGISDHELFGDEKRCMGCGIPCVAIMCARCARKALEERRYHLDAALGRAVREASAGPVLMNGWANDEDMPDVVRRVFRVIADALRRERP